MKKLAIMAAMVMAVGSASALDLGVRGVHTGANSADLVGVTVGQKFGPVGVEGAFDRTTRGTGSVNKWSLVGSYDVATLAGVTVAPKLGVSVINPSKGTADGAALTVGVGASYSLTKHVALVADYAYQRGQKREYAFNGNLVSAGVKYSF